MTPVVGADLSKRLVSNELCEPSAPLLPSFAIRPQGGGTALRVMRIVLAQDLQQARRLLGEQAGYRGDVGVGDADGYPEDRADPREGVAAAQAHERDQQAAMQREFIPPATLTGEDEYREPPDQSVREVECEGAGNQQGSCAAESRLPTPPSTARKPCASHTPPSRRIRPTIGTWTKPADEILNSLADYLTKVGTTTQKTEQN